jgi:two-component system nitrate/nitrite response regulator NarL
MTLSIGTTVNIEGAASGSLDPLIVVVDAHGLVASSLTVALRHAGFQRVAMVDPDDLDLNGNAQAIDLGTGDIVLVGLLYGDGRTALPLIRPLVQRGCRVIVMASDQGLPLAGECLHLGAETVLDKAMSFDRFVAGLGRLSSGGCAMTEEERAAMLETVDRHEAAERSLQEPFQALTQREADVLAALVAGTAPKQIAHAEGITVSTVRGHIQKVLSKLDVHNQREALAMARHAGWP